MNPVYEKLIPILEDFSADEIAASLKGLVRKRITLLKKTTRTFENQKKIESELKKQEVIINKLTQIWPDKYEA